MSGSGIKGGAYGFRVSSINKVGLKCACFEDDYLRYQYLVGRHEVNKRDYSPALLRAGCFSAIPGNATVFVRDHKTSRCI